MSALLNSKRAGTLEQELWRFLFKQSHQ